MPPYPAIHECPNKTWRIGKGKCRFKSKQAAIAAFEQWIKSKQQCDFEIFMETKEGESYKDKEMISCINCGKLILYCNIPEIAMGAIKCPYCNKIINQEGF